MPSKLWIVCELSNAGFGSINEILKTDTSTVLAAYDYLKFKAEYEHQNFELGREKAK